MIADAVQTLKEDIEVVAFLPGASYVFLLIASSGNSDLFFALAFASAIVGAALYNYLHYLKPETLETPNRTDVSSQPVQEKTSASDWSDPRIKDRDDERTSAEESVATALLLLWGGLLIASMYFLHGFFSENWILPEVLFFVSVGVLALYVTEGVLGYIIDDYRQ